MRHKRLSDGESTQRPIRLLRHEVVHEARKPRKNDHTRACHECSRRGLQYTYVAVYQLRDPALAFIALHTFFQRRDGGCVGGGWWVVLVKKRRGGEG
jgi:hypothetical protein